MCRRDPRSGPATSAQRRIIPLPGARSVREVSLPLADVQPRASGGELARRPGLTIVLIPADPDAPLLHELGRPDGPFVLEKPFTPEALAAKVRGALDAPRTHIRT